MINESIFKAYDIRGNYPSEINEEAAYLIGKSYGSYLQEFCDKNKCVIGHDNRLSSPSLTESLKKGLLESGINVICFRRQRREKVPCFSPKFSVDRRRGGI